MYQTNHYVPKLQKSKNDTLSLDTKVQIDLTPWLLTKSLKSQDTGNFMVQNRCLLSFYKVILSLLIIK